MRVDQDAAHAQPGKLDAAALFRAHAPFVARFLVRLGVRHEDAPDLVQQVFLVAHEHGGYQPGPAAPTTWLAAIAFRLGMSARRAFRKRAREFDDAVLATLPAGVESPFERVAAVQALCRVQHALETLDLEHRATFILFELQGESCQAIAHAFGIPVGTVYSRLSHARRSFRMAYERSAAKPRVERHREAP
jgi:RNA polymerase sigma-70 factor (ECF subfamily)